MSLIRCSPDHDATNGFFVSCFVRAPVSTQSGNDLDGKRKAVHSEADDSKDDVKKRKRKKPRT